LSSGFLQLAQSPEIASGLPSVRMILVPLAFTERKSGSSFFWDEAMPKFTPYITKTWFFVPLFHCLLCFGTTIHLYIYIVDLDRSEYVPQSYTNFLSVNVR